MKKTPSNSFIRIIFLQVLCMLGMSSSLFAQTWTSVESGGINISSVITIYNPQLQSFNNNLYAVWLESGKVRVKRYDGGTTWTVVDGGGKYWNSAACNNLATAVYNNALYITWEEADTEVGGISRIHALKYDGTTFTFVQSHTAGNADDGKHYISLQSTQYAYSPALGVHNGKLYASWIEGTSATANYQVHVSEFDGTYWNSVDGGNAESGLNKNYAGLLNRPFRNLSMSSFGNNLYVAWKEYSTVNSQYQLRVKRFDGGSSWTFVDGNAEAGLNYNSTKEPQTPIITACNGSLYAVWSEGTLWDAIYLTDINQIRVKKYDGSSWTFADGGTDYGWNRNNTDPDNLAAAYDPTAMAYNNQLYVAWEESDIIGWIDQIRAVNYNGTTKTFIAGGGDYGLNIDVSKKAQMPVMAEYNGELYAGWQENTGTSTPYLFRIKKTPLPGITTSVVVPANGTYKATANLDFTVNFNKIENVAGGTPYIPITLNTGGTVNATYVSGTGTKAFAFRYTVAAGNADPDGITVGSGIVLPGGCTIRDASSLDASLTLNSTGSTTGVQVDGISPTITGGTLASSNNYIDVTFSEGVYGASDGVTALSVSKFSLTFTQNGGGATNVIISSVKKNDNVVEGSASALTGGETTIRVFLTITGTPGGVETIEIKPANSASVYDHVGNAASASQTTGVKTLNDKIAPILSGAARTDDTHLTVTLSKNCINIAKANDGGFSVCETGAPGTTYAVSAIAQGSDASHVVLTLANLAISGKEGVTVKYTAGGNGTIQDNAGNMLATNSTGVTVSAWDVTAPTISSGTLASGNGYMDIVFSEGVYGASDGVTALSAARISLTFTQNGGSATNTVISSVKKNDNIIEGSASALTGGETTVRVFLTVTGTPNGAETIEIKPANSTSVYDLAGNATSTSQTTGIKTLNDNIAPTLVSAATTDNTHITVTLSENSTNITKSNDGGFTVCETGAPSTTYVVSAIAQGVDASHVVLTLANIGISGKEGVTVKYTAGGNGTVQDLIGNVMASNSTGVTISAWDVTAPTITSATLASSNPYIDILFNEGVYSAADGTTPLTAAKLSLTFTQNGGNATNTIISSVKQNNSTIEGSASALTGGETIIRVFLTITGTPSGTETIEIKPANGTSIYDQAGNATSASQTTGVKTLNDKLAPTVSISSTASDPTNASPIPVTITFSESVTDFVVGDIAVSNGTKGTLNGGPTVYTINITPSGQGAVTVNIAADVATDAAGNGNTVATQLSRTYDNQSPTTTLSSTASDPTNISPIPVTITFSESVTGFAVGDIAVTNGTKGTLNGGPAVYTIYITPSGQGVVTVNVAGGVASDAAGNGNVVATQLSRTYDAQAPTILSVDVPANGTYSAGTHLDFTVNLSEAVTVGGTPSIPIMLNIGGTVNATYQNGSGTTALVFRYIVVDGNYDNDGITIGAAITTNGGSIKDAAENNAVLTLNNVGNTSGVLVNAINPGVTAVILPANATYAAGQNLDFTVTFSQTVNVVTTGGIPYIPVTLNTGGTVNALYHGGTGTSSLLFRYTVVSGNNDADGIDLAGSVVANGGTIKNSSLLDAVLTLNGMGSTSGIFVDAVAPTISLVNSITANGIYKTDDIIAVTITFSEAVIVTGTPGLDLNSGGTALYASGSGGNVLTFNYKVSNGQSSADLNYSATNSLGLAGGTIKDAAGNNAALTLPTVGGPNSLGGQRDIVIDGVAPTVNITSTASNPTYTSPIPVIITFSESVTGFVVGDITVTNGTAGSFSGSGTTYTVNITPSGQGAVIINVAGAVAQDAAGNNNIAATGLSISYATPPVITSTTPGSRCDAGTVTIGATASTGTINWYTSASGGTSLGTGTTFTTPVISTTTTYYVDATVNGYTTLPRTSIEATVNNTPAITGTTPASRCDAGTVNLGATASTGIINWYTDAIGGVSLGAGTSYTTPGISVTTTYYVDATANGCFSNTRTAVAASINSVPAQPSVITGNETAYIGSTETYGVTDVPGETFNWSVTGGDVSGSGNSVSIIWNVAGNQTITVTPANGCGSGQPRTFSVAVKEALPLVTILSSPANDTINQPVALTLVWSTSTGASGYTVQVSAVSDFSSTVVSQSDIPGTNYNISGLSYETMYYWRVKAVNTSGESEWSTVWNFTTTRNVGVDEVNRSSDYKLYPNPVNHIITIENPRELFTDMSIYSMGGEMVMSKMLYRKVENIDLSTISDGLYTIKLTNKEGTMIRKVVKLSAK